MKEGWETAVSPAPERGALTGRRRRARRLFGSAWSPGGTTRAARSGWSRDFWRDATGAAAGAASRPTRSDTPPAPATWLPTRCQRFLVLEQKPYASLRASASAVSSAPEPSRGPTRLGSQSPGAGPQLQELRCPLHIGERPTAELQVELRILARRDPLAFDPRFHSPYLPLRCLVQGRRPQGWSARATNALTTSSSRQPAGRATGLTFPGLTPTLVVTLERVELRAIGPGLPSGRSEDRSGRFFGGCRPVAQPEQRRRRMLRACVSECSSLVDDQHVEVAAIRDLRPAETPHPDHGHRHRGAMVEPPYHRGAEIGESPACLLETREVEEVPGRDADGLGLEQVPESARPPVGSLIGRDHGLVDELAGPARRERPCRRAGPRNRDAGRLSRRAALVPRSRHRRRATSGDSRNAVTSRSRRCGVPARS